MAQAHLKPRLLAIDRGHAGPEAGAMHLPQAQHPIHPGVDHLVAEGAEQRLLRQGRQQGPGEHDLAEIAAITVPPPAVEASRAGEAPITPAQIHQGRTIPHQGQLEMLAVEPVEQGQQGFQGHRGGAGAARPVSRGASIMAAPHRSGRGTGPPVGQTLGTDNAARTMDVGLVRDIGSKALLAGAGALLLYWTVSAVKLVLSARGINPLIKQFFTQVASGQIDGAYLLTTKNYRSHVNRQQFIRFLAGLQLNKYRNLKSGRPRLQEQQVILTVKLKTDGKEELPLDFTFSKVEEAWRIDRIQKPNAA